MSGNVIQLWPIIDYDRDIMEQVRAISTPMLKRMWDSDRWETMCDEIHAAMNERGEGHYVAV